MDDRTTQLLFILLVTPILLTSCSPTAEYVIFKGFQVEDWITRPPNTSAQVINTSGKHSFNKTLRPNSVLSAIYHHHGNSTVLPAGKVKLDCPEAETPINIGPYEVPTDRDLVLQTIKTLHRLFTSYHQKAMLFLDDVQKVVSATDKVVQKCRGDKVAYKKCVRNISNKCKSITKNFVITLEQQRHNILNLDKKKICKLNDMNSDPVKLVKILVSEEASLEFALPAFLRLLGSCNSLCSSSSYKGKIKPTHHLTDADVVIRHFLGKEIYKRFSPKKRVIPLVRGIKRET